MTLSKSPGWEEFYETSLLLLNKQKDKESRLSAFLAHSPSKKKKSDNKSPFELTSPVY